MFSTELDKILAAAYIGQIESLFIDNEVSKWGKFDHSTNTIEINEKKDNNDEDLLEYASILTLSRGGKVYAVDRDKVPNGETVAAVLRY